MIKIKAASGVVWPAVAGGQIFAESRLNRSNCKNNVVLAV